jgi:hypothetical protein
MEATGQALYDSQSANALRRLRFTPPHLQILTNQLLTSKSSPWLNRVFTGEGYYASAHITVPFCERLLTSILHITNKINLLTNQHSIMNLKKLLLASVALTTLSPGAWAEDVTSTYLVNPSFEILKAADGTTDVTVKTTLSNGLYGWEVIATTNYQVESKASGSSTGFPASGSAAFDASNGTYYYFNRQGWGDMDGELKTKTSQAVPAGLYYFVFDYKAADYTNNKNSGRNGTTLGINVYGSDGATKIAALPALRHSYSTSNDSSNPGTDSYMVDAAWKQMGILFEVSEEQVLTFSIVQNLKSYGRSDVVYDNCHLIKVDSETSLTGMIANYDFEQRNEYGWTNGRINSGQQYTDAPNSYYQDAWNATYNMYQTITLPAGVYQVKAATRAIATIQNANIYSLVPDSYDNENYSTDITAVGNTDGELGNGWGWSTVNFIVPETKDVTIGFYSECGSSKWAGADDYSLTYVREVGADDLAALWSKKVEKANAAMTARELPESNIAKVNLTAEVAKTSINSYDEVATLKALVDAYNTAADDALYKDEKLKPAIAAAEALKGINVGTGAFQRPESAETALEAAIAAAQAVYDDANATTDNAKEEVEALATAQTAFTDAELNAPSESDAYNLVLNCNSDKDFDGNAVTFTSGNSTSGGYAIAYSNKAGTTNYGQAVYFKKVEDATNTYLVYIKDKDGDAHYIGVGANYGGDNYQLRATDDAAKALNILVSVSTTKDGEYQLKNTTANQYIGSNGNSGFYTASNYSTFNLLPAAEYPVRRSVAEGKFGTIILPYAAALPEGATAYSVKEISDEAVTLEEVTELSACVPYIIGEGTYNFSGLATAAKASYDGNNLTGVFAATAAPVGSYVLQTQDETQAFYVVEADNQPTLAANRAYLTVPSSSESAALRINIGGEATGVEAVKALTEGKAEIYDLSGRKLNTLQKGINIVNGVKVIVK